MKVKKNSFVETTSTMQHIHLNVCSLVLDEKENSDFLPEHLESCNTDL